MDLMIDIETLDTAPSAVILSVGICAFDMEGIHDKKYFLLDATEQQKQGRTISFDTIEWWLQQSKSVIDAAFHIDADKKTTVPTFLKEFGYFCGKNRVQKVWAQGTDFDLSMLSDLHRTNEVELPYSFWSARDSRTLRDGNKSIEPKREGDHHNAMDDAVYQAECVIVVLKAKL
jgi:hypothetical protein